MRRNKSRLFLAAILAGVVALLVCSANSGIAQLNCQNTQCVKVRYKAVNGKNIYCSMHMVAVVKSYAWSDTYAQGSMYGQDSIGGITGGTTNGNRIPCTGTPDCNNLFPVSGTVSSYSSDTENLQFDTVCTGTD